jgi:hypothetical protein
VRVTEGKGVLGKKKKKEDRKRERIQGKDERRKQIKK